MRNFIVPTIALLIVLISNYLGHVTAPFSILVTPFIIGFITWMILILSRFHILIKNIIIVSLILTNDILIRFYAGGTHDSEGNGWILLMFYIALIVFGASLIIVGILNKQIKWIIINLIVSILIVYFYNSTYYDLGMIWTNYPSQNIERSQNDNILISELTFDNSLIISRNDTFQLVNGWIEKEIRIDRTGFKKRISLTGKFNEIINIKGNFDIYGYCDSIQYKINDSTSLHSYPIQNRIVYNTYSKDSLVIYFYHNDKFKKKIITSPSAGADL